MPVKQDAMGKNVYFVFTRNSILHIYKTSITLFLLLLLADYLLTTCCFLAILILPN